MRALCKSSRALLGTCLLLALAAQDARAGESLRVGVLQYGTVSWQLDTMEAQGLHRTDALTMEVLRFASKTATSVALQAGEADIIVSDWIWAMRQRAAGEDFVFVPYSTALGAVMVADGSEARSIEALRGKRIGIAGGPLDKSWLILRTWTKARAGFDLADAAIPVFAAPPLLSEQMRAGKLDAVLTFWPYAARLETKGFRRLAEVAGLLSDLGIHEPPALVGYVFRGRLAREKPEGLRGFFRSVAKANDILRSSDEAWDRLRPLMKAGSEAEFTALKEGFRQGIPRTLERRRIEDARKLFEILTDLGGEKLVGRGTRFDGDVFWNTGAADTP